MIYEDMQCPICQRFEQANGQYLAEAVKKGAIEVEYRFVAFLDDLGASPNEYSRRASNAVLCAREEGGPGEFKQLHDLLYANQPAEKTLGPEDNALVESAAGLRPGRIGVVLAAGILALYAFGTHGRARVWSTPESLALSAVASHPYSMRANLTLVKSAFEHGNAALAEDSLARLASADDPRTRASAHLIRLYFHCLTRHDADPRDLSKAMVVMPPVITTTEVEYFSTLYFNAPQGCGRVTDVSIADALNGMVHRAQSQSDGEWQKWFLRGTAARFYLRADEPRKARAQAELAWQPGTDVGMAALVIQTQLAMADVAAAARTLAEAERRIDPSSKQSSEWIDGLRAQIDLARHAIPSKPK